VKGDTADEFIAQIAAAQSNFIALILCVYIKFNAPDRNLPDGNKMCGDNGAARHCAIYK